MKKSFIDQEVTTFPSLTNTTAFTSTWRQLVEQIRSSVWVDATQKYREAKQNKKRKEADRIKQGQPVFMAAGRFKGGRRQGNLERLLYTVFVDIDHVPAQELQRVFTTLMSDPHVLLTYRTISGEGVRAIVRVDRISLESYPAVFTLVNEHYAGVLGLPYDDACKDVTRASVLCHDADVSFREDPEPFHIDEKKLEPFMAALRNGEKAEPKSKKEKKRSERTYPLMEMDLTCRRLTRRCGKQYIDGHRNEFINHWAFLMASFGAERDKVMALALEAFAEHDADNTRSIIRSVFDNPTIRRDAPFERVSMQVCDMENWLADHYEFRYNTILRLVQVRPLEEHEWQKVDDRIENELWRQMQTEGVIFRTLDIHTLLHSNFPTDFDPFRTYLDSLPAWDGQTDYIMQLADTVHVKSDQLLWQKMLRNFLIGMLDCYFTPGRANELILIFLGRQGCYKTTWMERLLPPELRDYYLGTVQSDNFGKDDIIRLTNCILINLEELDVQNTTQQNRLKAMSSQKEANLRRAYGRNIEILKRIASFVATGNTLELLNDVTGNRRFFPVEIDWIDSPHDHPVNYAGVYGQAYALWKSGTRYWLNNEDKKELDAHNSSFMAPCIERDLVNAYYHLPQPADEQLSLPYRPHYVNTAQILAHISSGMRMPLNPIRVGQVMKELGFKKKRTNVGAMYLVAERTAADMRCLLPSSTQDTPK